MYDEETDGGAGSLREDSLDIAHGNYGLDLFGDFSILGTGVQIVLDGRTVSSGYR